MSIPTEEIRVIGVKTANSVAVQCIDGRRALCALCPYCETLWVNAAGEGIKHRCTAFKGDHEVFVKVDFATIVDLGHR